MSNIFLTVYKLAIFFIGFQILEFYMLGSRHLMFLFKKPQVLFWYIVELEMQFMSLVFKVFGFVLLVVPEQLLF